MKKVLPLVAFLLFMGTLVKAEPMISGFSNVGFESFTINWSYNGPKPTGYYYTVEIATNSSFSNYWGYYAGQSLSYTVTNLQPSTTYYTRIRVDLGGSNFQRSTGLLSVTTCSLSGPGVLDATNVNHYSFMARWNSHSCSGVNYYRVYLYNSSKSYLSSISTSGTSATFSVPGCSKTYFYRVRARDSNGVWSSYSSYKVVYTTPDPPVIKPPTNQSASSFTANWDGGCGAMGYQLYVYNSSGSLLSGYPKSTQGSSYTVSINSNEQYTYKVRGGNYGGSGPFSQVQTVLPYYAIPNYNTAFGSLDFYWKVNDPSRIYTSSGVLYFQALPWVGGGPSKLVADFRVDLSNSGTYELAYSSKISDTWGYYTNDGPDAVYFSDDGGTSFTRVYGLFFLGAPSTNGWQSLLLNINNLASQYNLSLSDNFVIRFQVQRVGITWQSSNVGVTRTQGSSGGRIAMDNSELAGDISYEDQFPKINVHPNPVTNYLFVEHNNENDIPYDLFDINGKSVKNGFLSTDNQIDVRELKEGAYVLSLKIEGQSRQFKIIK